MAELVKHEDFLKQQLTSSGAILVFCLHILPKYPERGTNQGKANFH